MTTREHLTGLIAALLLVESTGFGIINPKFTPRLLVDQSDIVVAGTLADKGGGRLWGTAKTVDLKGRVDGEQTLSLDPCDSSSMPDAHGRRLSFPI